MSEHPHARLMRDFYDAFGAADRDRLSELTTPDLVWHFPGHSPISGDWKGIDGVMRGIRAIAMTLGRGNTGFELLHVLAGDDCAVTIHRDFYSRSTRARTTATTPCRPPRWPGVELSDRRASRRASERVRAEGRTRRSLSPGRSQRRPRGRLSQT
jgi:ketosteroid isomerase-like protein